jgi:hypothetical protein
MNNENRKRVRWFKNELSSIDYSDSIIADLEEKLVVLDNRFEAHSPKTNGIHNTSASDRDQQLLDYTEKRNDILAQLQKEKTKKNQVEGILSLIPSEYVKMITDTSAQKVTWECEAMRKGLSRKALCCKIDRAILEAMNIYFNKL